MEDKRLTAINTILSCIIIVFVALYSRNSNILDDIVVFSSRHLPTSCLLILSLFVFKAFIPFFPSFALYTLSGRLLPYRTVAFSINLIGAALVNTLTYIKGVHKKHSAKQGGSLLDKKAHPVKVSLGRHSFFKKAEKLLQKLKAAISGGDFKTMVIFGLSPIAPFKSFGAVCGNSGVDFRIYITGTLIGVIPKVTTATFLGKSLSDPDSPIFIIALIMTAAVTVTSAVIVFESKPER